MPPKAQRLNGRCPALCGALCRLGFSCLQLARLCGSVAERLDALRKRLQERQRQAAAEPLFDVSNDDERSRVWRAIEMNGLRIDDISARIDDLQASMRETITQAVKDSMPRALLTDEEHRYVQLAIKRESQRIAFRQKVIDNTLTGLVWALVVGLGVMVKEYLVAHGWKM